MPFGLEQLEIGMREERLRSIRPKARPNTSVRGLEEVLEEGQPFVSRIEYRLRDGALDAISLGRHWTLDDAPSEIETLTPHLLGIVCSTWGKADEVGVIWHGSGKQYPLVVATWKRGSIAKILTYPPSETLRRAIDAENHGVPLGFSMRVVRSDVLQESTYYRVDKHALIPDSAVKLTNCVPSN